MPAALPHPTRKVDTTFWSADVDFVKGYLDSHGGSMTFTELARELMHRYANRKREALGLPVVAPHPPGTLP